MYANNAGMSDDATYQMLREEIVGLRAQVVTLTDLVTKALSIDEAVRMRERLTEYEEERELELNQTAAAEYCGRNSQWLIRQRKGRRIKGRKIGGQWFYRVKDLTALKNRQAS